MAASLDDQETLEFGQSDEIRSRMERKQELGQRKSSQMQQRHRDNAEALNAYARLHRKGMSKEQKNARVNGTRRITVRTKTISIRGSARGALKTLSLSKNLKNERWIIPSTRGKGGDRSRRNYSGYKTKQPGGTITTRRGKVLL